ALKTGGPKDASGGLKNALKEQSRIAEDLKQEHAVVLYSMADHAKYGLTPPETKVQERFLPHEVTKAFEAKEYKTVLRERDNIREPDRAARQARVQEIERRHERERADSIATLSAHWETSVVLAEISGVNIDMAVLQESIVEGMYATEYTEAQLDDVFGTKRENAQIQAKHQEYIKVIRHDIGLANDARLSRDVTENVDVYIAAVTYLRQIQKRLKVKNPAHLYPYAIAFIGGVTTTANKEDAGRLLSLLTIDLLSELPGNTQPDGLFGNQLIPVDVNGFTRVVVASDELMHNPSKMRPQDATEIMKMDDIAIGVIKTIKGAYRRRNPRDPDYLNPVLELPSEPTYQAIERRSRETV
ncbi:hypothetical protein KAZ57_03210, partial [Patescibacteria group bacterium]|nr:hypothetical protein [Patescibacteria group bacterium]